MNDSYFQNIHTTALTVFKERDINLPAPNDMKFEEQIRQAVGARHLNLNPLLVEDLDTKLILSLEPSNKAVWSEKDVFQRRDIVTSAMQDVAVRTQPALPTPSQPKKAALFSVSAVPHPK